jgi:hypothetical protein
MPLNRADDRTEIRTMITNIKTKIATLRQAMD